MVSSCSSSGCSKEYENKKLTEIKVSEKVNKFWAHNTDFPNWNGNHKIYLTYLFAVLSSVMKILVPNGISLITYML